MWHTYKPYVSADRRRAQAAKVAAKMRKKGRALSPVHIEGRTIARTFWGKAWCDHLESFSDYENRLPRGRTYVRNGSVIDLQITKGRITAQVMGSSLYKEVIDIAPLPASRWKAIKAACAGKIDSVVELLRGRLSDAVMRVITDRETGLFPKPREIGMDCSCPDWAALCKHLAAILYGVGARLDQQPELLFVLRGVDHLDLLSGAADAAGNLASGPGALPDHDLAEVFGIEIEAPAPRPEKMKPGSPRSPSAPRKRPRRKAAAPPKRKAKAVPPRKPAAKKA